MTKFAALCGKKGIGDRNSDPLVLAAQVTHVLNGGLRETCTVWPDGSKWNLLGCDN